MVQLKQSPRLVPCSVADLARALMHHGTGVAQYVVRLDVRPGFHPQDLAVLRAAFQDPARTADMPAGVLLDQSISDQALDLLRAVSGCRHLAINLHLDDDRGPVLLQRVLLSHHHESLKSLAVSSTPDNLAVLMQSVSKYCTRIETLSLRKQGYWPEEMQLASILRSIAGMRRLMSLDLGLGVVSSDPRTFHPVLLLPRLAYLELSDLCFDPGLDPAALRVMLDALAQRPQPLRALVLASPGVADVSIAELLFGPVGQHVLRNLWWLELHHFFKSAGSFDLFIDNVMPVMTQLQRLSLVSMPSTHKRLVRVLRALPDPMALRQLDLSLSARNSTDDVLLDMQDEATPLAPRLQNLRAVSLGNSAFQSPPSPLMHWPNLEALDLAHLNETLANQHVARALQHLPLLRLLRLPRAMGIDACTQVCRDVVPGMHHLSQLALPLCPLTEPLALVLQCVLPGMRALAEFELCADHQMRSVLQIAFADVPSYSLMHLRVSNPSRFFLPIPRQAAYAAVLLTLRCSENLNPEGLTPRSVSPFPYPHELPLTDQRVPRLFDVAATLVLTCLPADQDLGRVPETLSRRGLLAVLTECVGCNTYRRACDMVPCVRYKNGALLEALRCYSCHVRDPRS